MPSGSNPDLRQRLETIHQSHEQTIDTVSKDVVLETGFTEDAAREDAQSFRQFIEDNRDEIAALQVLYERPYRQRPCYADIRALADTLQAPPRSWTTERLWQAYQRLGEGRVRGSGRRQLADIVALAPFADHVNRRFEGWPCRKRPSVSSPPSSVSGWRHPRPHRRQRQHRRATFSTRPSTSGAASWAPTRIRRPIPAHHRKVELGTGAAGDRP